MAKITLSVYFEGTDGVINERVSLTSLFFNHTITDDKTSFKMAFEGCGTNNQYSTSFDLGGLFTYGLAQQVAAVIKSNQFTCQQ